MPTAAQRRRVKIGATIDAGLAAAVDDFVARHPGLDRSAVLDDALRLWCARRQTEAMEAQFTAVASTKEQKEREAWREIRRASLRRRMVRTS